MESATSQGPLSPERIMKIGMGFWPSKILLVAVKLELFTRLAEKKDLSAAAIKQALNLQCSDRHLYDWLDTLMVLGCLERSGLLETARYSNSTEAAIFLDKRKPSYIGGMLEMANNQLYASWGELENGLLTGLADPRTRNADGNAFAKIYQDPARLKEFVNAMSGIQMASFTAFAQKFDFSNYTTLADIGGSGALLSMLVAKHQPHISCVSYDLPAVEPVAQEIIREAGAADRVRAASVDFFTEPLPKADIIVMGNILHDWDEEKKLMLMQKAYEALPEKGVFVAIENVIDDERKTNAFGMMMSLNMLVRTGKGFDYTFADFNQWAKTVGYQKTALLPLAGNASAAVAYK